MVAASIVACTESSTTIVYLNNHDDASASDGPKSEGAADASDARDTAVDGDASTDPQQEPACDPSKSPGDDSCVVADEYGVFVSPSGTDTTTCGGKAAPCASITKGLARVKGTGKKLYVCADAGVYAEQVSIDIGLDGLRAYGGFKCSDWSYDSSIKAQVKPVVEGVAWKVDGLVKGTWIENFRIESVSATASGGSSIAVVVNGSAAVQFKGCEIKAGDGKDGDPGANGTKGEDGEGFTTAQQGTNATCTNPPNSNPGGMWTGVSACGSKGGQGGDGSKDGMGLAGQPGIPDTDVTPPSLNNSGAAAVALKAKGSDGTSGSPGNAGADGIATALNGVFSAAGFTPASQGGSGQDGHPGQGGGGGGASRAPINCVGASGGAGGMGGCGGKAGTGGASGGASVGVLSWASTVKFDACKITAGKGGAGGPGGAGGGSGLGKLGAPGGFDPTGQMAGGGAGEKGGDGGLGGSGAGGNGGPSHAIVYHGTAPDSATSTVVSGTAGTKGKGGTNGPTTAPDGSDGDNTDRFEQP
jgi:hypothetical protein